MSAISLNGPCHEFFLKIVENICNPLCTTGVNDTCCKQKFETDCFFIFCLDTTWWRLHLKVVTNEKQGGPGSWQMIDIGHRPW